MSEDPSERHCPSNAGCAPATRTPDTPAATNRLFQTSTMTALLEAIYDGDTTIAELLDHGNFGLGTFNALDGEMIVNDRVVHQFRADGSAGTVPPDAQTPFACITHFKPEITAEIAGPLTRQALTATVDDLVGNPNLIVAMRFTGAFDFVDTRTVFCQYRPYPRMLDVVAKQPTLRFGAGRGTMLGFRSPAFLQGLNVAGYHLHFLDDQGSRGGHVTDFRVGPGLVELAVISDIEIRLPRNAEFASVDLCPPDLHEAIQQAEGG